jgi:cytochrome c55X
MRRRLRALSLAAATVAALGVSVAEPAAEGVAAPSDARQRDLLRLLKQDCGSCHGMRLTGGLGPPLTPDALKDKPTASVAATIIGGRPGTAMPPWRPFLSEAEAQWLASRLREGTTDAR